MQQALQYLGNSLSLSLCFDYRGSSEPKVQCTTVDERVNTIDVPSARAAGLAQSQPC